MADEIVRATAAEGMIKISAISSKEICERARKIHNLSPVAAAALGRTLSAASIMGQSIKEENGSVTIQIRGGGPLGLVIAVSDSNGYVRGCVQEPGLDLPLREDGKLDVGGAVGGEGYLTVIRDLNMKEPYIGTVGLVGGEIAEDLAAYFTESEQIPSAVALGVLIERDYSVRASGGYIIQLMPGADDQLAKAVEKAVIKAGAVTEMLDSGLGAEGMIRKALDSFGVLVHEKIPVEYRCDCSRERMKRALISLGKGEIEDIVKEQGGAEMTCRFCDKVYKFDSVELLGMFE